MLTLTVLIGIAVVATPIAVFFNTGSVTATVISFCMALIVFFGWLIYVVRRDNQNNPPYDNQDDVFWP